MEEIDKNDTSEEKITEHEHEGFEEERNQPVEHEERKDDETAANIFNLAEKPREEAPQLFMPEVGDEMDQEAEGGSIEQLVEETKERTEIEDEAEKEESQLVPDEIPEGALGSEDQQLVDEAVDESPQTEEQTESKAPSTELVTSAVNRSEERPSIATQAASEDIEVQTVKEIDLDKYETVDKVSVSTVPSMKKERKTRLLSKPKPRKSSSTKKSIYYDFKPRFDVDFSQVRSSGDFGVMDYTDAPTRFYGYLGYGEEEEDDEVEEMVEEEEVVRIDREPYYQKYDVLKEQIAEARVKNYILQKKLSVVFKKRKMDHVLRETDIQYDTQQKYGKKLDMYGELIEVDRAKRDETTKELDILKKKRATKYAELTKLFQQMQDREKEIGYGLINTKTGNPIPDKVVERLIRRQQVQSDQVSAMRLAYIKLKDVVAEKQDAIASLDLIGDGLHLMDYEQLKVENRSHADKIEERDEELTRLRFKCQNTIQILAHIREKSAALENDIDDLNDDLSLVKMQYTQVREQLNCAKQERDYYRMQTNKLRTESGLLTEPKLLRDMEASMEELSHTKQELDQLKEENKVKTVQIRNIRKNIDFAAGSDLMLKKSKLNLSEKSSKSSKPKSRPFTPVIPENAFDYLKDFIPKVRVIRRTK